MADETADAVKKFETQIESLQEERDKIRASLSEANRESKERKETIKALRDEMETLKIKVNSADAEGNAKIAALLKERDEALGKFTSLEAEASTLRKDKDLQAAIQKVSGGTRVLLDTYRGLIDLKPLTKPEEFELAVGTAFLRQAEEMGRLGVIQGTTQGTTAVAGPFSFVSPSGIVSTGIEPSSVDPFWGRVGEAQKHKS